MCVPKLVSFNIIEIHKSDLVFEGPSDSIHVVGALTRLNSTCSNL